MKKKLLIVGAGGFGRVTLEYAIKDFGYYSVPYVKIMSALPSKTEDKALNTSIPFFVAVPM